MYDDRRRASGVDRRTFLRAAGATALVGAVAGCSEVANREFVADAVVLPDDAQSELGFSEAAARRDSRVVSRTVAGQDVQVTVESFVSVYGELDGELTLGVLSTPTASVAGQTLNPLARIGLGDLLTNATAESFLGSAGVGASGGVNWERGPERVGTTDGTLLGESVTVESHAGVLGGESSNVVYLHMARVEAGDSVVIAAGVHGFEVESTTRDYVGDGGYLPTATFDDIVATVVAVDAALVVDDSL
jgi:hypothetical protein